MGPNSLRFMLLLYVYITRIAGKGVDVDISVVSGNKIATVFPMRLCNGLMKYLFTPMDGANRFNTIKDKDKTIYADEKLQGKWLTVYKKKDLELLKFAKPKYMLSNGIVGKTLYFTKQKGQWKKIEKEDFVDIWYSISLRPTSLNLTAPTSLVRAVKKPDGRFVFRPINNHIFVTSIHALKHHIWPDKDEKGKLFKQAVYQNKNGKETFTVKYKDVNGDIKDAYWEFRSEWIRINKDVDTSLKPCNVKDLYLKTENGEYQKCSMRNPDSSNPGGAKKNNGTVAKPQKVIKTSTPLVLSEFNFLETGAESASSRFQRHPPTRETGNYGSYPKSAMYSEDSMDELKGRPKKRVRWAGVDDDEESPRSTMDGDDDVVRTRDRTYKKVMKELKGYHQQRGTWAQDNDAGSEPSMDRGNGEFDSSATYPEGTMDEMKDYNKMAGTWSPSHGRSTTPRSTMDGDDEVVRTRDRTYKKVMKELKGYHQQRGTWAQDNDDEDAAPPKGKYSRQNSFRRT